MRQICKSEKQFIHGWDRRCAIERRRVRRYFQYIPQMSTFACARIRPACIVVLSVYESLLKHSFNNTVGSRDKGMEVCLKRNWGLREGHSTGLAMFVTSAGNSIIGYCQDFAFCGAPCWYDLYANPPTLSTKCLPWPIMFVHYFRPISSYTPFLSCVEHCTCKLGKQSCAVPLMCVLA